MKMWSLNVTVGEMILKVQKARPTGFLPGLAFIGRGVDRNLAHGSSGGQGAARQSSTVTGAGPPARDAAVSFIYPPQTHSDLMSAMVATLGAGYLQVINYWFSKPKES